MEDSKMEDTKIEDTKMEGQLEGERLVELLKKVPSKSEIEDSEFQLKIAAIEESLVKFEKEHNINTEKAKKLLFMIPKEMRTKDENDFAGERGTIYGCIMDGI